MDHDPQKNDSGSPEIDEVEEARQKMLSMNMPPEMVEEAIKHAKDDLQKKAQQAIEWHTGHLSHYKINTMARAVSDIYEIDVLEGCDSISSCLSVMEIIHTNNAGFENMGDSPLFKSMLEITRRTFPLKEDDDIGHVAAHACEAFIVASDAFQEQKQIIAKNREINS